MSLLKLCQFLVTKLWKGSSSNSDSKYFNAGSIQQQVKHTSYKKPTYWIFNTVLGEHTQQYFITPRFSDSLKTTKVFKNFDLHLKSLSCITQYEFVRVFLRLSGLFWFKVRTTLKWNVFWKMDGLISFKWVTLNICETVS